MGKVASLQLRIVKTYIDPEPLRELIRNRYKAIIRKKDRTTTLLP